MCKCVWEKEDLNPIHSNLDFILLPSDIYTELRQRLQLGQIVNLSWHCQ